MGRSRIGTFSLPSFPFKFKCKLLLGFGVASVEGVGVIVGAVGGAGVEIFGLRFSFPFSFPTDFNVFLLIFVEANNTKTVTAGEREIANIKCCGRNVWMVIRKVTNIMATVGMTVFRMFLCSSMLALCSKDELIDDRVVTRNFFCCPWVCCFSSS